ncbi:uncharacterized protein LOC135497747 [Lineus longissimus]|uniref:uncharacterized protein LOC135497747 n=1 Tax=Lineus longissimus TaxID=88925 RepID=UPI002B4C5233
MSGESFIDNLKKGVFGSVHRDLKEYLSPLLLTKSNLPDTSLQRYAYSAARYLHAAISTLDTWPPHLFHQLVDSVHLCCQCITETQQYLKSPKEPLAIAKLVYHFINKLSKKGALCDVLRLSEFLHVQIEPLVKSMSDQQTTIFSIAGTIHAMLWNIAVRNGGDSAPHVLFQVYTLALKFYSINMQTPHILVQKAILVMSLYKNCSFPDSSDETNSVALAVDLFDSVVGSLKHKLQELNESSDDFDDHLHALLEIQQFEIRHFSSNGKFNLAREICQICSEFLNEVHEKKASIAAAYRASCRLLEASFSLSSISTKDGSVEEKKKLACDISTAIELIRFPSALGPRTYFTIVESLLQLKVQIESTYGQLGATTYSIPESLEQPLDMLLRVTIDILQRQKWVYLDQVNSASDKGAVKKLQTTALRIVDVSTSLLYMESGRIKSKQRKVSNADCSAKVDSCVEVLKTMKDVLDDISVHGMSVAVVQRYHILIYVAHRLGGCCYNRELYKEAIVFYKLAVEFWEDIKNDTSQQGLRSKRETSVWIWHVFEPLSDSLRQTRQTEKAMNALVKGFLADPSRSGVAAEAWYRIKRQVMNQAEEYRNTIKLRTFHQALLGEHCDLTNVNIVDLMEKELHVYTYNHRMVEEALTVISELLVLVMDPEKRANILISKAQQLWMQGEQGDCSEQCECLDEAIVLLNDAIKRGNSGLVLLAKAFLWTYIIKISEKCREKANKMKDGNINMDDEESSGTTPQEADNTSKPTTSQKTKSLEESLCDLMTLHEQNTLLCSVDKALEYATEACRVEVTDYTNEILEVLSITQAIYALTQNPIKELHCLSLLSSLLKQSRKKTAELMRTESRRVIILTNLCQFEAARVLLAEMIALEKGVDLVGTDKDIPAIHVFLLTQAQLYLVTGKVSEGFSLLEQVNQLKTRLCIDARADRSLLGWFHRLLAQYLALPLHQYGVNPKMMDFEYGNATSPLTHLTEAVMHHSYVVMFLIGWNAEKLEVDIGKQPRYTSLIEQWTSLDNLLTSLHVCATLMVRTGEVRQSTYYLKEGLDIALAFSLPKRCVQFLLGKTKLQALQHQINDAKLSLQVSHRILNFPDGYVKETDQDDTADVAASPREEECFGFVCDEEADGLSTPESTCLYRDVPQPIELYRCPPDCTCSYCKDVVLLLLRVNHYLAFSDTFSMFGYPAPDEYLIDCQQLLSKIQAKVNVCFMKLDNIGFGGKKDIQPEHESAGFCLTLQQVKLCIQHCLSALSAGSREFPDWAHKALELLAIDTNPDMGVNSHLVAQVSYLLASDTLQQFHVTPVGGAVDDLVDGIRSMQLGSEEPANRCRNSPDSKKMDEVIQHLDSADDEVLFVETDNVFSLDNKARGVRNTVDKKRNNQDSPALTAVTPATQTSTNRLKTPGNIKKKSVSFQSDKTPCVVDISALAGLKQVFRTPSSVSRRKALDLLMASSDDEDGCTPASNTTKRKVSTARQVTSKAMRVPLQPSVRKVAMAISFEDNNVPPSPGIKTVSRKRLAGKAARVRVEPLESCKVAEVIAFDRVENEEAPLPERSGSKQKGSKSKAKRAATHDDAETSSPASIASEDVYTLPISPVSEKRKTGRGRGLAKRIPVLKRASAVTSADCLQPTAELFMSHSDRLRSDSQSSAPGTVEPDPACASPLKPTGRGRGRGKQSIPTAKKTDRIRRGKNQPVDDSGSPSGAGSVKQEGFCVERGPCSVGKRKGLPLEIVNECNKPGGMVGGRQKLSAEPRLAKLTKGSGGRKGRKDENVCVDNVISMVETVSLETHVPKTMKASRGRKCVARAAKLSPSPLQPRRTRGGAKEQCRSATNQVEADVIADDVQEALLNEINEDLERTDVWGDELSYSRTPLLDESIEICRAADSDDDVSGKGRVKRCGRKKNVEREIARAMRAVQPAEAVSNVNMAKTNAHKKGASVPQTLLPSNGMKDQLLYGFDMLRHFPSVAEYRNICQGLALCSYGEDRWETAYYLSEAMNTTIRHQHIMNSGKKRRRLVRDKMNTTDLMSLEHDVTEELLFCKDVLDLKTFVSSLPAEWVICQLSVLQLPTSGGQLQLFLTRLQKGEEPIVIRLPGFSNTARDDLSYFEDIVLNKSKQSMEESNPYNWWTKRKQLCDQLKQFVYDIENDWFGSWKGLLLGQLVDDDSRSHVRNLARKFQEEGIKSCEDVDVAEGNRHLLELVIGAAHMLQTHQVPDWLQTHIKKPSILRLVDKEQKRQPVILVLDRLLQRVPFECLPVLHGHPVTRMFSLHTLSALLTQAKLDADNVFNNGVDQDRGFFVLNPDGNLAQTEKRLLPVFAEYKWLGISGVKPTQKQYKTAVSDYDLFLYSGHGCGRKYLACDTLQTTKCRAASLLFGCSSAALTVQGVCEGTGTIQHYFLGGAYFVLGNLWDITDKDIDIFAEQLLSLWLNAEPGSCLQDFISAARETCKLPYLVGSAPVCYGLPVKHK